MMMLLSLMFVILLNGVSGIGHETDGHVEGLSVIDSDPVQRVDVDWLGHSKGGRFFLQTIF